MFNWTSDEQHLPDPTCDKDLVSKKPLTSNTFLWEWILIISQVCFLASTNEQTACWDACWEIMAMTQACMTWALSVWQGWLTLAHTSFGFYTITHPGPRRPGRFLHRLWKMYIQLYCFISKYWSREVQIFFNFSNILIINNLAAHFPKCMKFNAMTCHMVSGTYYDVCYAWNHKTRLSSVYVIHVYKK